MPKRKRNDRRCRVCGCTDADCRQCIEATGAPCHWIEGEEDLCSRCADEEEAALFAAIHLCGRCGWPAGAKTKTRARRKRS